MYKTILTAVCLLLVCCVAGLVHADPIIDFEGYTGYTTITNQYSALGVDFDPTSPAVVLQFPHYNYGGYPPHSGTNVVYNANSGTGLIKATAVGPLWSHVSLWYTVNSSSPITADNYGLYIDAYDSSNNLIASSHGGNNYGSNSYLDVSAAGISYVKIHDHGNYFTIDDFSFHQESVPEPGQVVAFLGMGGMGLIGWAWRRRKIA